MHEPPAKEGKSSMSDKELLTTNTRPSREDYPLTEAGDLGFSRALVVWQGDAIDRLTAERDRLKAELDNLRATDIHSCHDGCQRPACVMRRERDALKAENERLRASHEPLTDHMAALIDSAYYEGAKLALIKADESIQVAREWLAGGCNGRRQAALAILRHAPPPNPVQPGWTLYQRVGSIEARPYEKRDGFDTRLSVSAADRNRDSLEGGMVARNPDNHDDRWYIAPEYFAKHYRAAQTKSGAL